MSAIRLQPTPVDVQAARRLLEEHEQTIHRALQHNPRQNVAIESLTRGLAKELTTTALEGLVAILREFAEGHNVEVQGEDVEADQLVSPRQAAEILGMSRPKLTRLLKVGAIPHRMVGTHHRVPLSRVLEYRETMERTGQAQPTRDEIGRQQREGLKEMADLTAGAGLGY